MQLYKGLRTQVGVFLTLISERPPYRTPDTPFSPSPFLQS